MIMIIKRVGASVVIPKRLMVKSRPIAVCLFHCFNIDGTWEIKI